MYSSASSSQWLGGVDPRVNVLQAHLPPVWVTKTGNPNIVLLASTYVRRLLLNQIGQCQDILIKLREQKNVFFLF